MRKWAGINKNTIVDWFNFCRKVCAIYMDQIDIPKRLEGLEKWGRLTSPSMAKENITAAEEEKDSGFGEAWREVLTKYLCKSLHRVMRRRFYQ